MCPSLSLPGFSFGRVLLEKWRTVITKASAADAVEKWSCIAQWFLSLRCRWCRRISRATFAHTHLLACLPTCCTIPHAPARTEGGVTWDTVNWERERERDSVTDLGERTERLADSRIELGITFQAVQSKGSFLDYWLAASLRTRRPLVLLRTEWSYLKLSSSSWSRSNQNKRKKTFILLQSKTSLTRTWISNWSSIGLVGWLDGLSLEWDWLWANSPADNKLRAEMDRSLLVSSLNWTSLNVNCPTRCLNFSTLVYSPNSSFLSPQISKFKHKLTITKLLFSTSSQ